MLWLLEPELAELLTGGERLKPVVWGGLQSLAVPGLREMLEEPVAHKRAAWQAMVQHGFTA